MLRTRVAQCDMTKQIPLLLKTHGRHVDVNEFEGSVRFPRWREDDTVSEMLGPQPSASNDNGAIDNRNRYSMYANPCSCFHLSDCETL